MAIEPTAKDIGRRVSLRRAGEAPLIGTLKEVLQADRAHATPFAMVVYPDMKMPVATYLNALEWAPDDQLI